MALADDINAALRDFQRYTGDGLPNAPIGHPLPIGDPRTGVFNPSKKTLRDILMAIAQTMGDPGALQDIIDSVQALAQAGDTLSLVNVTGTGDAAVAEKRAAQADLTATHETLMTVQWPATNTASDPTLTIDSMTLTVRRFSGSVVEPGELVGGRRYLMMRAGPQLRVIGAVGIGDVPGLVEALEAETTARQEADLEGAEALAAAVAERDSLIASTTAAVIPDVGPVAVYEEAGETGPVVRAVRSSDGRTLTIDQSGELEPVANEADLVAQQAQEMHISGVPLAVTSRVVDESDDGRVVSMRDDRGNDWRVADDLYLPATAPFFDVVIYGSGLAALTAARAARDLGMTVCIVTPDDRLGGMMSGGISVFDIYGNESSYAEWMGYTGGHTMRHLMEIHGLTGVKPNTSMRRAAARLAEQVANRWGTLYADRIILNSPIHEKWQSLLIEGKRIVGINTAQGPVRGAQFIEASYTGDLLRRSGASWTATREGASATETDAGFNYAGSNFRTLNLLNAAHLMGYSAVPPETYDLNDMWRIEDLAELPAAGSSTQTQMAFNIRSNFTSAPDRIRFADYRPDGYDRARYVVAFADALRVNATSIWDIISPQDGLIAPLPLPDGEPDYTVYNNNGGLLGTHILPKDYATARWSRRREIEHETYSAHLGFMYFFATDDIVTAQLPGLKASVNLWGFDPREWSGSPWGDGVPNKIYERQTIRLVNDNVLTKPMVQTDAWAGGTPDPIGVFQYRMDTKPHHYIALDAEGDGSNVVVASEGYASGADTASYAIPMSIMLPRRSEVENLTVAWCVATTDFAWRSLRMEPSGGLMGEAAGIMAALAVRRGVSLHDVDYASVRQMLIDNRGVLPPHS